VNLENILASTVIAAFVAAIVSIISTHLDNRSKSNDSVCLFRYTKLYEIVLELSKANNEVNMKENNKIGTNSEHSALNEIFTKFMFNLNNLINSYSFAKPLVDEEYWADIEVKLTASVEILKKTNHTSKDLMALTEFDESIKAAEKCFHSAVEKQMKSLLKTR